MESGFDESKSDLFVSVWNNYSKTIIDKLKQGTISEKQVQLSQYCLFYYINLINFHYNRLTIILTDQSNQRFKIGFS